MKKEILGLIVGAVCFGTLTVGVVQMPAVCHAEAGEVQQEDNQDNQAAKIAAAKEMFYAQWKADDGEGSIYNPAITNAEVKHVYRMDDTMTVFGVHDSSFAKDFYAYIYKQGTVMYLYEEIDVGQPFMYFTRVD